MKEKHNKILEEIVETEGYEFIEDFLTEAKDKEFYNAYWFSERRFPSIRKIGEEWEGYVGRKVFPELEAAQNIHHDNSLNGLRIEQKVVRAKSSDTSMSLHKRAQSESNNHNLNFSWAQIRKDACDYLLLSIIYSDVSKFYVVPNKMLSFDPQKDTEIKISKQHTNSENLFQISFTSENERKLGDYYFAGEKRKALEVEKPLTDIISEIELRVAV